MRNRITKRFLVRAAPLVLAGPLVLGSGIAYLALSSGSQGASLPVAQGAAGGAFHPLAGTFEPDSTELPECGADAGCLQQAFGNLAYREGPKVALEIFETRVATDDDFDKVCHPIAHMIGAGALERYDGDVARTFAEGTPSCISGYYHGILERAFVGATGERELADRARSLCEGASIRRRGFLDYQCRHGLGHGLMIQTGYDLPLALSICGAIGTRWDRVACGSGVFMENVDTRFGFRSRWLDDDDPFHPCSTVAVEDKYACYQRSSFRVANMKGGDVRAAVPECAGLGRWASACFEGYGRDSAVLTDFDAEETLGLCRLAAAGRDHCLFGAAMTIANASGSDGIAPSAALCRAARTAERRACFAGVGWVAGLLYPTNASRRSACAHAAAAHAEACTSAAIARVDPAGGDGIVLGR